MFISKTNKFKKNLFSSDILHQKTAYIGKQPDMLEHGSVFVVNHISVSQV